MAAPTTDPIGTIRTYEIWDIEFPERGSTWTGFSKADAHAWAKPDGVPTRRTFEVWIPDGLLAQANPGIAERRGTASEAAR